jgi:integrase
MRLEDIDWARGELAVRSKKGGGLIRLPLPGGVGAALARYLRHARPKCACRQVFVCMRGVPRQGFSGRNPVGVIVRRSLARAGLHASRRGAHAFRHALARELLKHGASLGQIGRVLRHKDPESTAIYAKVDLEALRALALPWAAEAPAAEAAAEAGGAL